MRERLVGARKERGLSQAEVAKLLGVSRQCYGQIETGARNPRLPLARRIAEVLGGSLDGFFFDPVGHISCPTVEEPAL